MRRGFRWLDHFTSFSMQWGETSKTEALVLYWEGEMDIECRATLTVMQMLHWTIVVKREFSKKADVISACNDSDLFFSLMRHRYCFFLGGGVWIHKSFELWTALTVESYRCVNITSLLFHWKHLSPQSCRQIHKYRNNWKWRTQERTTCCCTDYTVSHLPSESSARKQRHPWFPKGMCSWLWRSLDFSSRSTKEFCGFDWKSSLAYWCLNIAMLSLMLPLAWLQTLRIVYLFALGV